MICLSFSLHRRGFALWHVAFWLASLGIGFFAVPVRGAPVWLVCRPDSSIRIRLPYIAQPDDSGNGLVWKLNLGEAADDAAIHARIENAEQAVADLLTAQIAPNEGQSLAELLATLNNTPLGQTLLQVIQTSVTLTNGSQKIFDLSSVPSPSDSGVTQAGTRADITLVVAIQQPTISDLEILVVTRRASQNPQNQREQTTTLGSVNALQTPSLTLSPRQQAIRLTLRFVPEDALFGDAPLLAALGRAGWLLYRTAIGPNINIDLGKPLPADSANQVFSDAATQTLALPTGTSMNARFGFEPIPGSSDPTRYQLFVLRLPLVTSVTLESAPYAWEDEAFRHREGAAAERIAAKRRERIQQIANEAAEKTRLDSFSTQLTAQADGWQELAKYAADLKERHPEIASVEVLTAANGDDFKITLNVRNITPSILTIKVGGSYSVEDRLTADVAINGDNYANQTANFSLKLKAGEGAQRATLTGQKTHAFNRTLRAVYSLDARLFHDPAQALGNTPVLTVEERETGVRPEFALRYDSSAGVSSVLAPGGTRQAGGLSVSLDYRDVNLSARGLSGAGLEDGTLAAFRAGASWGVAHSFARGAKTRLTRIEALLSGTAESGMDALGGRFRYNQNQLSLVTALYFGAASQPDALLLRYRQGFGTSSGGTPLFRLFRMGGADTVRGLENGEALANNYGFRQLEFGVSLAALGLAPKNAPVDDFAPAGAYLKIFYDSARVTSGLAFDQLLGAGPGLEGYGAGLEFRKLDGSLAVTLGYAFSPDSRRHRSGTFFSGVSLLFN